MALIESYNPKITCGLWLLASVRSSVRTLQKPFLLKPLRHLTRLQSSSTTGTNAMDLISTAGGSAPRQG